MENKSLLTDCIIKELEALKKGKYTYKKISDISGINQTTVWRSLNNINAKIDFHVIVKLEECGLINPLKHLFKN